MAEVSGEWESAVGKSGCTKEAIDDAAAQDTMSTSRRAVTLEQGGLDSEQEGPVELYEQPAGVPATDLYTQLPT